MLSAMVFSFLFRGFQSLLGVTLGYFMLLDPTSAQIRTDGSTGPARALAGPNFAIGADLGKQVGSNLFHSFSTFNVGQGQTATFHGPASVANVIGRVTGGQTSQIEGQIASTIPGANLFLLNPSGWVFGSHATLNVQGSFHVSSADNLRFSDGTHLSAGTPGGSNFTAAQPAAFGFLGARSGAITATGSTLATPVGKDLSIVGGPVRIAGGQITVPAGQLHIASAAASGEIGLNGADAATQTVSAYGPVTLTGNAIVDVGDASGQRGGGAVQLRGGAVLVDGSSVRARNYSAQPGGTVSVQANTLTLTPGGSITSSARAGGNAGAVNVETAGPINISGDGKGGLTGISSTALSGTSGRAGGVSVISGGELTVTMGGQVGNNTAGKSGADTVSVTAPKITLDATASSTPSTIDSEALAGSSGAPGTVSVRANDISLRAGGRIDSLGFGPSGSGFVDVRAADAINADGSGHISQVTGILSDVNLGSRGDAGGVLVETNNLLLQNQAQIRSNTYGGGKAGAVQVVGTGALSSVTIEGGDSTTATGILSNAQPQSAGKAGNVAVSADSIRLLHTGQISSNTFAGGDAGTVTVNANTISADGGGRIDFDTGIFSNAERGSGGNAGPISVTANAIDLRNQGVISSGTFAGGNAGRVTVNANTISADGGAQTAFDTGIVSNANLGLGGNAGPIAVTANTINLSNHGVISSDTFGGGNAGEIHVTGIGPASSLTVDGGNRVPATGIVTDAEQGSKGAAGSVTVSIDSIRLLHTGQISSNTFAGGDAGTVTVNANTISADGGGRIDFDTGIFSNAERGSGGNAGPISVTANAIDLRNQGVISSSTSRRRERRAGDREREYDLCRRRCSNRVRHRYCFQCQPWSGRQRRPDHCYCQYRQPEQSRGHQQRYLRRWECRRDPRHGNRAGVIPYRRRWQSCPGHRHRDGCRTGIERRSRQRDRIDRQHPLASHRPDQQQHVCRRRRGTRDRQREHDFCQRRGAYRLRHRHLLQRRTR